MRIFISVLVLIFNFQSSTNADAIAEFEIEGISIGDSLLNSMDEKDIKKSLANYPTFAHTDKKFQRVFFEGNFEVYEYLSLVIKVNDPKYIIYAISGMFDISNPETCLQMQSDISEELSKIFKDADVYNWNSPLRQDETGKSMGTGIEYYFTEGGSASIVCYDFKDYTKIPSGLDVSISNKEFDDWIISFN